MNPQRVRDSFFTMVAIESPSWHEAAMARHCERELANMGFSVAFDDSSSKTGSDTGNLIAHLPGTVSGRIVFSAHMDTVKPCAGIVPVVVTEEVEGEVIEVIRSAGDTILSADDKAGVAAIFEGVRSVVESGDPRPDITVLLTTCEEQSLLGSSALDPAALAWPADLALVGDPVDVAESTPHAAPESSGGIGVSASNGGPASSDNAQSSEEEHTNVSRETFVGENQGGEMATQWAFSSASAPASAPAPVSASAPAAFSSSISAGAPALTPCFVFDADGHPGSIVVGAPYHYTMRAAFAGRAAHAGVEPEAGASAIQMAAHAIAHMPLGRIDMYTTANVGVISGGAAVNVVPDRCVVEGECRSLHEDHVEAQRDAMAAACRQAAEYYGGEVELTWALDYPGVLFDDNAPIVRRLARAAASAGLEVRKAVSGGGADANVLSTKGVEAITLGVGMSNFHSTDEYIAVRDLEDSARYVEAIIAEYAVASSGSGD